MTIQELNLGLLGELPYSISIEESNVKAISRYLNEFVMSVDRIVCDKFIAFTKQKIAIRLDEISVESRLLLRAAKQEQLNEIAVLTEGAKIAKSLGIIKNNREATVSFAEKEGESEAIQITTSDVNPIKFPLWYLYGEKALLERIKVLESRTNLQPFIPELVALDIEKNRLESIIVDRTGLTSMQLSKIAIPSVSPIKPNKIMIILIAFIGSFMMSIFLALVMGALKPDEIHST